MGLVVEGRTEAAAFRKLPSLVTSCPPIDRPASVDGIGASATAEQVARRIAPDIAFLQADNKKVVVCVDRESRNASAAKFAEAIMKALEHELPPRGGSISRVAVVAADRAFEAWLLADISGLCARVPKKRKAPRKQCFESYMRAKRKAGAQGYHYGDDVLANTLGRYEKMRDGPRLFAALDFARAQQPCNEGGRGSVSLRTFIDAIRT